MDKKAVKKELERMISELRSDKKKDLSSTGAVIIETEIDLLSIRLEWLYSGERNCKRCYFPLDDSDKGDYCFSCWGL